MLREHTALMGQTVAFAQIAAAACCNDILPMGPPPLGTGNDMVERQFRRRLMDAAILTSETVTQKDIEPRESRIARS